MANSSLVYACRVLVVDDCVANRALLAAILTHRRVAFEQAIDGQEALTKFESQVFDLVLMDIQMPVMDGFTATSEIRRKWPERRVAIVAVTASVGDFRGEVYRSAGFTEKISKPFELSEIDALLSKYGSDNVSHGDPQVTES